MKGFVDIKEVVSINGGDSLVSSIIAANEAITLKYGVVVRPPVVKYGVRPLYGIYPVTITK
ncbi:hypothetical protein [Clostridium cellulovorans]|uniref:Uncharacterized protein n=1 Tax=Clostridium cellulovorans (strain ATCC 35296 / DSM 3052 / OCM 3 / 743B) TaxID=573061 RepID=D9SMD1_CLOC7|nr:hypothetical protein [Clostridium cellulovorans]ADL53787.1 hypothetical protein Clocel_4126 [Clostridium cellulovorans 743B]